MARGSWQGNGRNSGRGRGDSHLQGGALNKVKRVAHWLVRNRIKLTLVIAAMVVARVVYVLWDGWPEMAYSYNALRRYSMATADLRPLPWHTFYWNKPVLPLDWNGIRQFSQGLAAIAAVALILDEFGVRGNDK